MRNMKTIKRFLQFIIWLRSERINAMVDAGRGFN
jgi:hypothetical protein